MFPSYRNQSVDLQSKLAVKRLNIQALLFWVEELKKLIEVLKGFSKEPLSKCSPLTQYEKVNTVPLQ